ncbi:hypothetical protein EV361DRAFT_379492 [Lentinula raphanica]|nr:hypothetical protein EV361DRAFT_379492 [Lentinula raphanica]
MYSLKPSVPRALRNHAKRAAMSGDQEEPPNKRSRTENRASSSAVELPQAPLAGPSSAYTLETSSAAEISAYNQGLRESAASTANLRPLYYPKLAPTEITRDYSKPVPLPLAPPTNFLQVAPKKPGKVHPNTRDFKAQLKAALPTREHMNRFIAALDVVHKKPLSPSTVENYERAKRWWLLFFEEQTGSEEQAQLTLARDAPAPPITLFKCFLLFAATQGNSHIHKGGKGWSVKTLKMFCTRVFAMRLYYNCAPPPRQYCQEVYNAIDAWLIEGVLHADSHDKQIIRESDLVNMLSAFLRGQSDVSSRFMLVQAMWFLTFLYETGARPGTVVQSPGFRHTDHYLKWEDSKWIVTGWTEKLGLTIEVHWRLRWAKGMHMDNSKFMCVYQRNHELERAHIDSITMLEALAVHQDIFEIDPLQLRSRDPKTLKLPIELKMKPDKGKLPVLMNRKKDDVLGYSTLMAILKRVASALGYKRFIPRYMRYGWATAMAKRLSKANLRYFLGHVHKSKHGETTYQSTIQPVDVAAMRFDEISNTETAEYLSSIAYGAEDAQDVSLSLDQLERDPYLQDLLAVYREKEAKVVAQYHCLSHEVTEESLDNSLVSEAQDAWSDVLERYFSMVSKVKIGERVVFDDAPANAPSHDEPKDDDEDDEKLSSEVPVEKNPEFKLPQDVDPEILSKIFSHQSSKLDALVNSDNDHPLVPLVQDAKSNVRGLLLKTYVNLLEEDNLANKHQCPTCMSKPNLPIEKRTKDHKDHWAQHYLSCMFNDASDKNLFICPLCLVCFANPPPGETQLDIYDKEIDEHVEACLTKMMARKFDGSDPSEEEPARKSTRRNNDYGVGTLSVTTRLGGSRTSTTRYFCPVCLFDKSVTGDARTRWNHRLHWTLAVVPLLLHMSANHWNRIGTGNGIDYHKTFTCGFPDCPNEQEE